MESTGGFNRALAAQPAGPPPPPQSQVCPVVQVTVPRTWTLCPRSWMRSPVLRGAWNFKQTLRAEGTGLALGNLPRHRALDSGAGRLRTSAAGTPKLEGASHADRSSFVHAAAGGGGAGALAVEVGTEASLRFLRTALAGSPCLETAQRGSCG